MILNISNLSKTYGSNIIYDKFNIEFEAEKINCILGRSGCGKSTLLNLIVGALKPDNEDFKPIERNKISYIFQEDRLIEWITLEENMKLIGKRYYDKNSLDNVINKYLDLVGIKEYRKKYPQKLSGGIRQRGNIARALIKPSKYIIMDEPFKSIDVKIKYETMKKIKHIIKEESKTAIFVTHDIDEALFLADKIFVLGEKPVVVKGEFNNSEKINKEDIIKLI